MGLFSIITGTISVVIRDSINSLHNLYFKLKKANQTGIAWCIELKHQQWDDLREASLEQ